MGKDRGDRLQKGARAASSALAAEKMAATGGFGNFASTFTGFGGGFGGFGAAGGASFGGGFGGASAGGEDDFSFAADSDSELVQHLQRLSKRDPTTRLKALQSLRALAAERSPEDAAALLPAWAFYFRKVTMDNSRFVRAEAAAVMGAFSVAAGKRIAPHLKALLPSWHLLKHDPNTETAQAARAALASAFPSADKQAAALAVFGQEILTLATDVLDSTSQSLGDPKKESPEELQDRFERATCASLAVIGSLSDTVSLAGSPGSPPLPAQQIDALRDTLTQVLNTEGFWKRALGTKAPGPRRAALELLAGLIRGPIPDEAPIPGPADSVPAAVAGPSSDAAPAVSGIVLCDTARREATLQVLASIGDREAGLHSAVEGLVLLMLRHWPDCWALVGEQNVRKAVLPKVHGILRHGGHGHPEALMPTCVAVLASLPRPQLGPSLEVVREALGALAEGWRRAMEGNVAPSHTSRVSLADAYTSLVRLGAARSRAADPSVPPGDADPLAAVLSGALGKASPVAAALSAPWDETTGRATWPKEVFGAARAAVDALAARGAADEAAAVAGQALDAIADAVSHVSAESGPPFAAIRGLLTTFAPAGASGSGSPAADLVVRRLVGPIASLCHHHIGGGMDRSGGAADTLGLIVGSFGAAAVPAPAETGSQAGAGPETSLDPLLSALASAAPNSPAAHSTCRLLSQLMRGAQGQEKGRILCAALCRCLTIPEDRAATREAARAELVQAQPPSSALRLASLLLHTLEGALAGKGPALASPDLAPATPLSDGVATWLTQPDQLARGEAASVMLGTLLRCGLLSEPGRTQALAVLATRATFAEALCRQQRAGGVAPGAAEALSAGVFDAVREACCMGVGEAPGAEGLAPIWLSALVSLWELRSSGAGGPALRGSLDRLWDSGRGLATYLRRCPPGAPAAPRLTTALEDALVTALADRAMMKDDAGPLTAEDLDLWADRVDEVVTGLHLSGKGGVARVAARLDLSLQPVGPAAQAAFLWGLASRLGLPEVLIDRRAAAAAYNAAQAASLLALYPPPDYARPEEDLAEAVPGASSDPEVEAEALAAASCFRAELHSALIRLAGHHSSSGPEASSSDEDEGSAAGDDLDEAGYGRGAALTHGRGLAPLASSGPSLVIGLAGAVLRSLAQNAAGRGQARTPTMDLEPVRAFADVAASLGQVAATSDEARAAVSVTFKALLEEETRARLEAAGCLEPLVSSISAPLRASDDIKFGIFVSNLLGACIREPHPLAHLAHSDHAAAARSLASLRMATGCLLASTQDGVALVSANEASQAAELTKRLIKGSRSGRRALGMLGPRLAVPSSTAADASEARRIALEADGCASALALLCLNRSVSVASDAPGALGPLGPLLVDHAKEALAGVTAALEELAETTALVASDILRDYLHIDLQAQDDPVPTSEFLLRLAANGTVQLPAQGPMDTLEAALRSSKALLDLPAVRAPEVFAAAVALSTGPDADAGLRARALGDLLRCFLAASASMASLISLHDLSVSRASSATGDATAAQLSLRFRSRVAAAVLAGPAKPAWDALGRILLSSSKSLQGGDEALQTAFTEASAWAVDSGAHPPQALLGALRLGALALEGRSFAEQADAPPFLAAVCSLLGESVALEGAVVRDAVLLSDNAQDAGDDGEGEADLPRVPGPGEFKEFRKYLVQLGLQPQLAGCAAALSVSGSAAHVDMSVSRTGLIAWHLLLRYLRTGPARARQRLNTAFKQAQWAIDGLLDYIAAHLPDIGPSASTPSPAPPTASAASSRASGGIALFCDAQSDPYQAYVAQVFTSVLAALPASVRSWYAGIRDRSLSSRVERYATLKVCPRIIQEQLEGVREDLQRLEEGLEDAAGSEFEMSVRSHAPGREVVATMEVEDGARMELAIKLPVNFPLRPPEVECRQRVGVTDARVRKWLLSITTMLRNENGSVAEALVLWRRNVGREFEGLEACLVCYSIVHPSNSTLPKMQCRTCKQRFHAQCLYQWFKSSGKSQCAHCQAIWS